ncbi:oligosaccharyl transferase, archaeosortase A system-associated [Halococcus saccharolyticus]|uniref:dolichyl-phosphooligosaccharide-protein glycotransferase n=1 Tax=Halococcus saccharolyticus DSM 5350 TaxID=1227455 RepID=M0MJ08_9EURY|nr:oligosaccharyl transferase, archaeosortase A system-associated [Halococcus saccharolyticus]EMA44719.1 transmembrane oligosaccharyl transferase [Halococcus saccharolyticus DSM 5350]
MSQRREQLAERLPALDALESWYHVPLLVVLVGFMFWIRVRNWRRFLVDGEVLFSGNDAWYHLRQVEYTVVNWPSTLPFEPWTSFPTGTAVGQFGTLYDQIVATAALVIGLGSPSEQTTALTLLFAPAVFGTLVAIPAYFLAKRFGGRFGGVVGVAILALSPSTFLARSVAGFSDHHAAEAFFQVLAVAVIVIALTVAEREKPVYEQFVERDASSLRRPIGWAVLAGIAISVYIWVWPPGLLLVGIFGVFLLIALPAAYLRGESPEHVAIVSAVTLSVVGVLTLVTFQSTEISVTSFSLLHPALAFLGAIGCVFMAWLARTVEARDLPGLAYPGTILGLFVLGAVVMAIVTPSLFEYFLNQLERIVGLGSSATALTVGEAQPPFQAGVPFGEAVNQALGFFRNSYGLAFFTGIAGAVVLFVRLVLGRSKQQAAAVFILVWTALMVAATLTQTRFNYYLIVPICVLNAVLVGELIRFLASTDTATGLRNLEAYQVLTVLAVVLLITAPLVVGSGAALTSAGGYADERSYPGSTVRGWSGSLDWMANNTPAEGTYGGYNNSMDYYGEYERTDDFDYPDGAYGVLSWWDYGHWITTLGERIPTANPFQQNARQAANFLLADNVSRANEIARTEDGEGVRYVMIDWRMADPAGGALFTAPFTWYNDGPLSVYDDVTPIVTQQAGSQRPSLAFYAYEQRHYETMRTRLYSFHGSAVEPEPVVVDYESPIPQGGSIAQASPPSGNESAIKRFDNMSAARAFVEEDGSAQIGGVGAYPQERVAALEHYRLADASQRLSSQLTQTLFQRLQATGLNASELVPTSPSWVKTFERVPGAAVEGTGPANTTVEATVEMRMPGSESTFNYTQQATTDDQGEFTMTLPYSTTGYEQWGTEQGATNVSVQATGPYTFQTPVEGGSDNASRWNATAEVSEGAVIGRTNESVTVDLQQESVSIPADTSAGNDTASGNASAATNASATENGSADANASSAGGGTNATGANMTNASSMAAPGERVADATRAASPQAEGAR